MPIHAFFLFSFFFTKDLIFTVAWVKLWYHYADCYLNPIYSTPLRCVVVTSASRHLGKCHRTNRALKFKTDDVERRRRRRTISQRQLKNLFFKKWTIPGPFFYFRLLSTADIKCSIYKFCDDGIRTADLWFGSDQSTNWGVLKKSFLNDAWNCHSLNPRHLEKSKIGHPRPLFRFFSVFSNN